ncbi:MAG TPA: 2-C-methyl-D-erythritol 2,4-cyclodiphosphate synthase [Microthrixaceae bacterium]|jgi:2-C-methyl-D-erythritol 4-phosphate cytidylyltransferase/2-C-methyl-D-erythritol 2,4-cyclodiphosphate synthase|nr:2-C-methyl-D-erythritol 2,4-cyclodiphosphate synthase [Microthrixaceae bacterium]
MDHRIWSIVVAAGSGQRYGAAKQFEPLAGARVVDHSLAVAARHSDGVVVVVPPGEPVPDALRADVVVEGGATRSESVRRGLAAVPGDTTIVLVHDAARPVASDALFRRVVDAVLGGAAVAVPAIEVADTIRHRDGGVVDRSELLAVQTPQGFDAAALRAAHANGGEATDDASLVEARGGTVVTVAGERTNIKITEPADLVVAAQTLGTSGSSAAPPPSALRLRVGNGFDIHRFSDDPDRVLVLGGVTFEGARGLHGHSDADVVAHACSEALLGAVGRGDLGSHFPDTDERWRGANSMELLAEVVRIVAADGMVALNIDCSVIAESPKLAPRRHEMEAALSAVVGAPVSVKGRRAEGIGGLGRREGIAAMATALLTGAGG